MMDHQEVLESRGDFQARTKRRQSRRLASGLPVCDNLSARFCRVLRSKTASSLRPKISVSRIALWRLDGRRRVGRAGDEPSGFSLQFGVRIAPACRVSLLSGGVVFSPQPAPLAQALAIDPTTPSGDRRDALLRSRAEGGPRSPPSRCRARGRSAKVSCG